MLLSGRRGFVEERRAIGKQSGGKCDIQNENEVKGRKKEWKC